VTGGKGAWGNGRNLGREITASGPRQDGGVTGKKRPGLLPMKKKGERFESARIMARKGRKKGGPVEKGGVAPTAGTQRYMYRGAG